VLGNTETLKETHIHTEPTKKKRLNIIEEVTVTVTPAYTGISQHFAQGYLPEN
jgi:hypothetical protein